MPKRKWDSTGFGERLKTIREAARQSQQQLADATGVDVMTVSRLERGAQEPAWPLVLAICDSLGVSTEEFRPIVAQKTTAPTGEKSNRGQHRKVEGKQLTEEALLKEPGFPILWGAWTACASLEADRRFIQAAASGWPNLRDFAQFLYDYELLRGPLASGVVLDGTSTAKAQSRLQAIANILNGCYAGPLSSPVAIAAAWWKAVTRIQKEVEPHHRYWALCLKALWFRQPETTTMWDSHACRALKLKEPKTQAHAEAFLRAFEESFAREQSRIVAVVQSIQEHRGDPSPYPYGRRVFDKALWFRGIPDLKRRRQEVRDFLADASAREWIESSRWAAVAEVTGQEPPAEKKRGGKRKGE
jgi:transcriptional regulator with XRE-family HTH domain